MHCIKLIYDPEPKTQTLKESITFCASINLFCDLGIECFQTSASTLAFENGKDCLLASLYLSDSRSFTPKIL